MTDLLDTAPDTPVITLEHPAARSAPASRPRGPLPRGRRRGTAVIPRWQLRIALALGLAASAALATVIVLFAAEQTPPGTVVPPDEVPIVLTTTVPPSSSRGSEPTPAREEASPVTGALPAVGAVTGDTQPPPARGDGAATVAGSGGPVTVGGRPPAGAPEPPADQPAATQPPPTTETPAPAEPTTTTGPPDVSTTTTSILDPTPTTVPG